MNCGKSLLPQLKKTYVLLEIKTAK